ncbi:hypothetical protein [Pseudomonas fluorescens]|uniref:hypothetical protein n=1 Tax=Pseudomonas fluorescens TaxID=294 RepID=UPI003D1E28D6
MDINWSKAPSHATHWCPGNARITEGWIYQSGGEFYSCYADRGLEHIPAFPDWKKSRLVPRPLETSWTGEGLPPVGTDLECGFACEDFKIWHAGVCIAVGEDPEGREEFCVVKSGNKIAMYTAEGRRMRPIRTPEQIAAEERDEALNEMIRRIKDHPNNAHGVPHLTQLKIQEEACIDLYDAGYRKQVTT